MPVQIHYDAFVTPVASGTADLSDIVFENIFPDLPRVPKARELDGRLRRFTEVLGTYVLNTSITINIDSNKLVVRRANTSGLEERPTGLGVQVGDQLTSGLKITSLGVLTTILIVGIHSGMAIIGGSAVQITESNEDPPDPPEGKTVIWMSDGTSSGDDGDLLAKITVGGVTKTGTILDYSAL